MNYIVLTFKTSPELHEILEAELAELGYDAFWETDNGLRTAIAEPLFDRSAIQGLVKQYAEVGKISFQEAKEAKQNWNANWETSFEPIEVEETCRVRAHFHEPKPDFPYEIIITPKMSFGTGHHETTRLMIGTQLGLGNQFKDVLDLGTGTGVLAILAKKLGAKEVWGFDIEDWAVENAQENVALNETSVEIRLGTVQEAKTLEKTFDLVLANINRNVLLEEIPEYIRLLNPEGVLLLSGFYEEDLPLIREKVGDALEEISVRTENRWVCWGGKKK